MDTSDYLVLKKEFIDDVYTSPSERVQPGGDDNFWTRSESPLTGGPFKSLWLLLDLQSWLRRCQSRRWLTHGSGTFRAEIVLPESWVSHWHHWHQWPNFSISHHVSIFDLGSNNLGSEGAIIVGESLGKFPSDSPKTLAPSEPRLLEFRMLWKNGHLRLLGVEKGVYWWRVYFAFGACPTWWWWQFLD